MGIFTKMGGVYRIVSSPSRRESCSRMRRLSLLFLVAMLSSFSFSAWADTHTYTLAKGDFTTKTQTQTKTTDGVTWTLATESTSGFAYAQMSSSSSYTGFQFGSKSSSAGKFTFSTSDISGAITKITVNAATGGNATISATVGGNEYIASTSLTKSNADYSGTGSSSGEIVISFNASSKAMYVNSITVEYGEGGEVTKNFSYSAKTATAILGKTFTAPTLTNEYGTAVTYSSSDESVATVAADGTVTLVAAGTTTITATLDADNTVTASYTLSVYEPVAGTDDEITSSTLGITKNTTYQNVSYTSETTGTVYSGQAAYNSAYNNTTMLRNQSPSGLVAYNAALTLVAIKVDWNSTTASDRSLLIYGKTDAAYSSSSDLYTNTTQGTYLGEIAYSTSTAVFDLTNTDNIGKYHAVGVLSSKNAVYFDKITFVWSDGTTTTASIDVLAKEADNSYFGTYYDEKAYTMNDDVTGYVISSSALVDGVLNLDACTKYVKGDVVPAKTALLVWAAASGTYPIVYTESTTEAPTDNLLYGGIEMSSLGSGYKFYKLAYADADYTDLGFYYGAADGAAFTLNSAHHAFLAVLETSAAKAFVIDGGNVTAIDGVEQGTTATDAPVYSLSGVRMNGGNLPKGVYIKNGKKFVKK